MTSHPLCLIQPIFSISSKTPRNSSAAFLAPLPVTNNVWNPKKLYVSSRNVPSAHLRRRPAPLPPLNTGYGSKERPVKSVRYPELTLFTRVWEPKCKPTAGLVIIPGLQWHSGWFSTIAIPLSRRGVRVLALDPLSTGRSDNISATRSMITDMDDHVDDAAAVLDDVTDGLPKRSPVFVLSESSGGTIACNLAMKNDVSERVRAWVFCAPAIAVAPGVLPQGVILNLMRRLGKRFPKLPTPGEKASGETYDRAFGDGVSHELSKRDPYVQYSVPIPLGTSTVMLGAMENIESALSARKLHMREVLVLHNRSDQRTLFSASQGLVDRVRTDHGARLVDMGGSAHQLFQEKTAIVQETVRCILEFVEESRMRDM